jgi:predicted metal-dependent hydrolase
MTQIPLPWSPDPPVPPPPFPVVVFVRHPRARHYVVSVRADGAVRVTIPRRGSKREAEAFARSRRPWIERQLARATAERAARPALAPELERALREQARRELPARLLELAALHGLTVSRVSVRNQRWRWGSCSRNGHICLNWRLASMPAWVRDYVLVHELMHLERMDHSPAFWRLVAGACPRYQDARRWLRSCVRGGTQLVDPSDHACLPGRPTPAGTETAGSPCSSGDVMAV